MHLYDAVAKEGDRGDRQGPGSFPFFFLLVSLLFHFTMVLVIRQWVSSKPARIGPQESMRENVIDLVAPETVAPPPEKKPPKVLFGTNRPEDLKAIPPGKETHLPPIPKSDFPGLPSPPPAASNEGGSPGGISPPASTPLLPPPASLPAPSLPPTALPEGQKEELTRIPPLTAPTVPSEEADLNQGESLPSLPSQPGGEEVKSGSGRGGPGRNGGGEGESVPRPNGLPGLPFANARRLDQLAKVFSDQERAPKDPISLNTDDLKYFSYNMKLVSKIEYVWRYPQGAAERGMQGELLLTFTIHRDGQVSDVRVVMTSGHEILDQEVVRAVKMAAPFAPLPDSWKEDQYTVTGHFIYHNRYTSIR